MKRLLRLALASLSKTIDWWSMSELDRALLADAGKKEIVSYEISPEWDVSYYSVYQEEIVPKQGASFLEIRFKLYRADGTIVHECTERTNLYYYRYSTPEEIQSVQRQAEELLTEKRQYLSNKGYAAKSH
jgi:hypothetical protein